MKKKLLAKRYAEALFALVKQSEEDKLEQYAHVLHTIAQAFTTNTTLCAVFTNPLITEEEKKNIMHALLRDASSFSLSYLINFCMLLVTTGRILYIHEIDECYQELLNLYQGKIIARITTAVALDEEGKAKIQSSLSHLGKIVDIIYEVDSSLLGGIVLTIGDIHVDASLRKELNTIYKYIVKGGHYGN